MHTIPFLDVFDGEFEQTGQHRIVNKTRQITLLATSTRQVGTQSTVSIFRHHD